MSGLVHRRIVVVGRVQGVGYRHFARETARALGVAGWTRNASDGTVLLEVAAAPEVLEQFMVRLRAGPRSAVVHELKVSERASTDPLPNGFIIRP